MLNIQKLSKKPKIFHSLCGMTPQQFNLLLKKVTPLWQKAELRRKSWQGRIRKIGGGRRRRLNLEQSLFLLLLYYRTYVNHVFLGMIAGIDDSKICKYFALLNPVLAQVFEIPQRKIAMSQDEILELIVDATEQETERRPGSGYSGKKKRQTIKTQIHVNPKGRIKAVSKSFSGNIHDKKVYDESKTVIFVRGNPRKIKKKGDLGYLGTECEIPRKSSKYHKLTPREKQSNQELAKQRIVVEHVFSFLKKFHILRDKFRNKILRYNLIFKNICGIRNFITA